MSSETMAAGNKLPSFDVKVGSAMVMTWTPRSPKAGLTETLALFNGCPKHALIPVNVKIRIKGNAFFMLE